MKQEVKIGQTDYTALILIRDTAGAPKTGLTNASAGLDVCYTRVETDNDVVLTDGAPVALATPALTDPHLDWGFLEVNATKCPGLYRLDIADGVFATGAWSAVVSLIGTGLDPCQIEFILVPVDPYTGVNVSTIGGTVQTANDNGADINDILVDTAVIGALGAGLTALATQASVNTIDGIVDDILVDTGTTLDALIKDVPTVAEFEARSLVAADYTIVADLGVVQTADHTAAIADIPTVAEFNARTLPSADYTIVADLGTVQTADHTAGIADIPTVAEFNARTIVSADYTIVADLGTVQTADHTVSIAAILADTNELQVDDYPTSIAAVKADTAAILIDTGTTLQGEIDAIEAAVITNAAGVDIAADIIALKAVADTIQADTDLLDDVAGGLADIHTDIGAVKADTAAILIDTGTTLDGNITAIKAITDNLPSGIKKNTALANFEFYMVLAADHISPATGKTIVCQRSIDGAAFANCNTVNATEVSAGIYKLNLAASDLNGDVITFKASEATCDTRLVTIKTST